jgi:hypothetical protein
MTLSYPSWAVGLRCNEKATKHLHRGKRFLERQELLGKITHSRIFGGWSSKLIASVIRHSLETPPADINFWLRRANRIMINPSK